MRLNKTIYLSAVALSMAASAMLTSCNNEPEPIPAQETYLRNFILKYGLIDPEQDWNIATTTSLTLISDGMPRNINVLVSCGDRLWRVGEYRNVSETIRIDNLDIPEFCDKLYIECAGDILLVDRDAQVDLSEFSFDSPAKAPSRASSDGFENLAWLIAAEDLGSTDDTDFNDIIFRFESVSVNFKGEISSNDWQVIPDEEWVDLSGGHSRADGTLTKKLKITALASGGTLPLWLHYRSTSGTDYVIGYNESGTQMVEVDDVRDAESIEWHRWFGVNRSDVMINTGTPQVPTTFPSQNHEALGTATVYVSSDFSVSKYSYVDYDKNEKGVDWDWNIVNYNDCNIEGFYITVGHHKLQECKTALYQCQPGAAPQMFLIPDAGPGGELWHWPTERKDINEVYPNFSKWVTNAADYSRWFENYAVGSKENIDYMRK